MIVPPSVYTKMTFLPNLLTLNNSIDRDDMQNNFPIPKYVFIVGEGAVFVKKKK